MLFLQSFVTLLVFAFFCAFWGLPLPFTRKSAEVLNSPVASEPSAKPVEVASPTVQVAHPVPGEADKTILEIPLKLYNEDLPKYFNVSFLWTIVEDPDITEILNRHDITQDNKYKPSKKESVYDVIGPVVATSGGRGEKRYYISKSGEKGYGVFADAFITKGSVIGVYTGVRTAAAETTKYEWKYQSNPFRHKQIQGGERVAIGTDASKSGNALRFINDGDQEKLNCKMVAVAWRNRWYPVYVATKDIYPGDELMISYGANYWKRRKFYP